MPPDLAKTVELHEAYKQGEQEKGLQDSLLQSISFQVDQLQEEPKEHHFEVPASPFQDQMQQSKKPAGPMFSLRAAKALQAASQYKSAARQAAYL